MAEAQVSPGADIHIVGRIGSGGASIPDGFQQIEAFSFVHVTHHNRFLLFFSALQPRQRRVLA